MKLLTIKSLLAASLVAYGATALNLCSSGSIQTNTQVEPATPGSTDYISDCSIAQNVAVTYMNTGAPNVRAAAMVLRVVDSRFGPDSRMLIIGNEEYNERLNNNTACTFVVERNTFGPGAMVYVRGAFAPDTTISISGNSFDFGYPLTSLFPTPPGPTETFASAVYMHDMFLLKNVVVAINSNIIKGNSTNGYVAVNAINFGGDVYFNGAGASIEVDNNDIDILCNATSSFGTAIGGEKTLYMYAADAKFSADNNRIRAIGSSSVLLHPSIVVAAPGSGTTSFSNNVITADTTGMASVGTDATYRPVIRAGQLNIQSRPVNVWIANNTIDVTGALASVGFSNDLTCGTGCAVYVKDNTLAATGADPRVHFLGSVELSGNGALWLTGNDLSRASVAAAASPVFFGRSLRITEQSAVAITGNTFSAASPVLMAELSATAQSSFTRASTASLFLCGNSFGGAALATIDEVKAVTSTALGNAAVVDDCPAVTTTVATNSTTESDAGSSTTIADTSDVSGPAGNATTTEASGNETVAPQTTTDPLPNNKGSAASAAAAVGAALLAAAAMLL